MVQQIFDNDLYFGVFYTTEKAAILTFVDSKYTYTIRFNEISSLRELVNGVLSLATIESNTGKMMSIIKIENNTYHLAINRNERKLYLSMAEGKIIFEDVNYAKLITFFNKFKQTMERF